MIVTLVSLRFLYDHVFLKLELSRRVLWASYTSFGTSSAPEHRPNSVLRAREWITPHHPPPHPPIQSHSHLPIANPHIPHQTHTLNLLFSYVPRTDPMRLAERNLLQPPKRKPKSQRKETRKNNFIILKTTALLKAPSTKV